MTKITRQQAEILAELYDLHGGNNDGIVWISMQEVLKCLGIKYRTKYGDAGLIIDESSIIQEKKCAHCAKAVGSGTNYYRYNGEAFCSVPCIMNCKFWDTKHGDKVEYVVSVDMTDSIRKEITKMFKG